MSVPSSTNQINRAIDNQAGTQLHEETTSEASIPMGGVSVSANAGEGTTQKVEAPEKTNSQRRKERRRRAADRQI